MFKSHQNADQIYNTDSQGQIKFGTDALKTCFIFKYIFSSSLYFIPHLYSNTLQVCGTGQE
jgi:hypothetical protein